MVSLSPACVFGLMLLAVASQAFAQTPVMKQFSQFSGGGQGLYWVPSSGPISHVAFLAIHRTGDFLAHVSTQELPRRGFSVLGMNSRFKNNEAAVNWELIALDVRAGVRFLRSQPGITKVILIGHSGGGPTTSYFQAVAENGTSYCNGPNKLSPCTDSQLTGFVATDKADGIVFLDAHPGNTVNGLRSLNAAVIKEDNPDKSLRKKLDPFDPKNGFNPTGDSIYSDRFVKHYTDEQSERMNDLIHDALKMRADIASGKTLTSFLSANSIRSRNSLDEIDWCSSNNSTPCAVGRISVPILVMSMQGHYFIRDGEQIYESSVSADKDFIVVEGATHGLGPCNPCATLHGANYSNARINLFNYIREWATPRF